MAMNLFDAARQWAERPADQRFWTLKEMYDACKTYAEGAAEATVNMGDVRLLSTPDNDLRLMGKEGQEAKLTHWSFGQLATRAQAPAGYLRGLPGPLAAQCVNHGLIARGEQDDKSKVLFHRNGSLVCRAFTGDGYARIWNYDVAARLVGLEQQGWRVPPARPAFEDQPGSRRATEQDVLARTGHPGMGVKLGDWIAPAGIYASDHDMFAFLVNEEIRIDDGTDGGMARGFFVSNSEVGAAAFKITRFLYRYVCGNHIVWDAKDVQEMKIIHVGQNDTRFGREMAYELTKYAGESTALETDRITKAKGFILGKDKDAVLDELFKLRVLPRKTLEKAYEAAIVDNDLRGSNPRSVWGMVQGVTCISQQESFADERVGLDRAAGKILSMAF